MSWYVSRGANESSFYIGNKNSNPYFISIGMLGTSMSGITFISVPGTVQIAGLQYIQLVLGYLIGYILIIRFLLPLYYRLQVISVYEYLNQRFNITASRTGAIFFIISRLWISALRLYLILFIIYEYIFKNCHISFEIVLVLFIVMMFLYTYKGGVKTLVWTDMLQSICMLVALICSLYFFSQHIQFQSLENLYTQFKNIQPKPLLNMNISDKNNFFKQIIGAILITFAMTGLDQEMMQKCLSIHTLKSAKRNIIRVAILILFANALFLLLGILLTVYAHQQGIQQAPDNVYPFIAFRDFPFWVNLIFVIGLISTSFPSIDGAITAITSSICIDILKLSDKTWTFSKKLILRRSIHFIGFLILSLLVILFYKIPH
ncbi:MAG: sodium:solute symporter family transporter, partial [Chitinophagaceae bacterium]